MQHLNTFKTVSPPTIPSQPPPESDTGHPRRSAYAAMHDLQEPFSAAGIETDQVWEHLKDRYSVNSRSLFSGLQWATIAAELQACRRDAIIFKGFVDSIPDHHFRIHVFTDDPSVAIGRPRDLRKHHLPAEWFDFQVFATENQCRLTVEQGKSTTYFEPKQTRQPAQETQSAPKRKPVIALNTNARGEVLNVFGDVVDVSA